MRRREINSKYLCYLLRHKPESINVVMDRHGWVSIEDLLEKINRTEKYRTCFEQIRTIVDNDDKGRFRISDDGKRIKACQGHSIPWIEPELEQRIPPKYLYHGTTAETYSEIERCGAILKMSRHAVHLHEDELMAWQVACRRKNKTPIVIGIDDKTLTALREAN